MCKSSLGGEKKNMYIGLSKHLNKQSMPSVFPGEDRHRTCLSTPDDSWRCEVANSTFLPGLSPFLGPLTTLDSRTRPFQLRSCNSEFDSNVRTAGFLLYTSLIYVKIQGGALFG